MQTVGSDDQRSVILHDDDSKGKSQDGETNLSRLPTVHVGLLIRLLSRQSVEGWCSHIKERGISPSDTREHVETGQHSRTKMSRAHVWVKSSGVMIDSCPQHSCPTLDCWGLTRLVARL